MELFGRSLQKVIILILFLIYYDNVGCLEMLGVGGPEWVHRYQNCENQNLAIDCKLPIINTHKCQHVICK